MADDARHPHFLELWLIRHGETDYNRERRIQGQANSQLTDLGVAQAKRLALRLMGERFDRVYSSDLDRAMRTAEIVYPEADIRQDARLREICRGVLEGKTHDEFNEEDRRIHEEMARDRYRNRPPGGECYYDLECRVRSWLEDLPKEGRVAAFTHGGFIHLALHVVLGPPQGWRFTIHNTSITRLRVLEKETVILGVNDYAHLEGQPALASD